VIVPYLISRSPHEFYQFLSREKVTVLNQTPSAFRQLIWAEETAETKLPLNVRYVICAGEALELQSLKPWFDRHGDEKPLIVNMYGITEITVHATYRVIRKQDLTNGSGSVIGVPIPDLQIYLVDEDLKPVPAGVPGEICVGGAGVARGYLNRPDLNDKRFLPDPFSTEPGAIMYRSGDLAQFSAKGELEYLGRMDHQVKIRGFRVELGEIESGLNAHPAIRESAVIAHDDRAGGKRLVAYVVPINSAPTVTDLRAHLGKKVPDYMIPATFMFLESFPLNTNGKIDRRALPIPPGTRPALKDEFTPPQNPTEETLAKIWAEVLQIDRVGTHDNFFELGGDSILSIRMLTKAQQQGLRFSLQQIFQSPTIEGLARCAELSQASAPSRKSEPFSLVKTEDREKLPPDAEDAYPLSRLQMGMFFHNEMDPLSAIYHDVFSFRIQASLDREKLQRAIEQLISRHPVLRTSFHLDGFSEPLQIVHRPVSASASIPLLTSDDLRDKASPAQQQAIADWIEQEKRNPFERTKAPLLRFHAQLLSQNSFQFILSFHHVCLDGWSLAALITELFQDYAALLKGATQTLSSPAICYRDFIALEQETINSEASRRFWSEKLKDASFQTFPRWPQSYCTGGHEQKRGPELQISADTLNGLKRLAQNAGVPLKTVLLAAHQRVAALLYGTGDVVSGLLCNGRPEAIDGDRLIGLFLNTVPLRLHLGAPASRRPAEDHSSEGQGGTWLDLVKQTFAAEQELIPHRRFPLIEIQKLNGGRRPFEFAFDFVHFHVYKNLENTRGLDLAEGHYFEANDLTAFTTFMLDLTSSQLQMHMDYDPNELCREQIEEISQYYVETLEAMASDPAGSYASFSPLSEAERRRILVEWNATESDYPKNSRIHELVEQQVAQRPEATALVFEGRSWSYAELDRRANALAAELQNAGAGPNTLVGIFLERSAEMVIALLATLKAGGAYVPLDPAYPTERLAWMIQDSGLSILLTQQSLLNSLPQTAAHTLCLDASDGNTRHSNIPTFQHSSSQHVARNTQPATRNNPTIQQSGASPLAYVIYTSGSTGKPKGVQITHRSVVNLLISAALKLGFGSNSPTPGPGQFTQPHSSSEAADDSPSPGVADEVSVKNNPSLGRGEGELFSQPRISDNLLAVTTLSFDIAALELLLPLITGGTVTIANRETASDGKQLAALLEQSGANYMQATPVTWRLLIESGWAGRKDLTIICGGEALSRALADELLNRAKEVWNFYGPTETTIWSSAWKVAPAAPVSIGRPLTNTHMYILDERLQPVPIGTIGELYIGGHGLALGYLNQPALTVSKFISADLTHHASRIPLYKTGDLARFLPDGNIECLGRSDHQVKIRGFRIELGEIEAVLRQHPGIANVVIAAPENAFGEKRLVGYIVSRNGPLLPGDLREFVSRQLPHHMIPAHWVFLEQLPLTPNGKVDMKKLPSPDNSAQSGKPYIAPRDDAEAALAKIWQEVLSLKQIGVEDNFFDLGSDSLTATRAFARMTRAFETDITLREIFEHPTIASLATVVRQNKGRKRVIPPILPRRAAKTVSV
jgi:non-ribosomal peptide synthetase component F/aryl carrier-like protein